MNHKNNLKKLMYSSIVIVLVLSVALTPSIFALTSSVVHTLSVTPDTTYSDGTIEYSITVYNMPEEGATDAYIDVTLAPPTADGTPTTNPSEMIHVVTDYLIEVGDTDHFNKNTGYPELEITLNLNPAVTSAQAKSFLNIDYVNGETGEGEQTVTVSIINPNTEATITANPDTILPEEQVTLTIQEENTGNSDLTNPYIVLGSTIYDENSPTFIFSTDADSDGVLDTTETWEWHVNVNPTTTTTYEIYGHGTDELGNDICYENGYLDEYDCVQVTVINPAINIEKYVSVDDGVTWLDADSAPGPEAIVGSTVKFKVVVENTGDCELTGIVVSDTDFTFTGIASSLLPGESDESDIYLHTAVAGQHANTATVIGTPPAGSSISDCDQAHYFGSSCIPEVWVDDDFTSSTPGWNVDHFASIQPALDRLDSYGTAWIYDGIYEEDILVNDIPCDNTGITIRGIYGCFPTTESAIIQGTIVINVDDVTVQYLEFAPTTEAAITVGECVTGTMLECNKFRKDCIANAIGVQALGDTIVDAEMNWWGVPDGPDGGVMDDEKIANGLGVKIFGDVQVEPWIGIHAEIAEPTGTIEVNTETLISFDATGSFAYSFGECCEPTSLHKQYLWDFDDGTQSSNKKTTHMYDEPGTYVVSLMVDSPGIQYLHSNFMYDWAYVTVHVGGSGTPLTANADGKNLGGYETTVGKNLQLYGDASGGQGSYRWLWTFGDSSEPKTEQNPMHIYEKTGTYAVELTVFSGNESTSNTAIVEVKKDTDLQVRIKDNMDVIANEDAMFSAEVSGGKQPYRYYWSFGDGATSRDQHPVHQFNEPGTYNVKLTVTDDTPTSASHELKVNVNGGDNHPDITDVSGGFVLSATIKANNDPAECNIYVNSLNGKIVYSNHCSGIINEWETKTLTLPLTIGLGLIEISITANTIKKEYHAFLLGPFILNLEEV